MISRPVLLALFSMASVATLRAQPAPPLTLTAAIAEAQAANPSARASAIAEDEAQARVGQARAALLPRVDVTTGWQRSDNPVFAFSSLLAQGRFTAANFAIRSLNDPDPLSNYRSGVSLEQVLFDGGASWAGLRQAGHGRTDAGLAREAVRQQVATKVTEAFGGVLRLEGGLASARAAVEAADADLRLTTDRRDAGLVTEADVLAVAVHHAQMREQVIRFESELAVARAALNEALGRPLDAPMALDDTLPAPGTPAAIDPLAEEQDALERRPDVRRADLGVSLAGEAIKVARAAFLPQVVFQGGYEVNGDRWTEGATNWMAGLGLRWSLFRGGGDWARLTEARLARDRATVTRDQAREQARLDVRAARARLAAAHARLDVARRIVEQARESQRILRDRYESGLVDVASLLQASQAVVAADAQALGARVDLIVSTAHLDRALGR